MLSIQNTVIFFTLVLLYFRIYIERNSYMINECIPHWRIMIVIIIIFSQGYLFYHTIRELRCLEPRQGFIRSIMQRVSVYLESLLNTTCMRLLQWNFITRITESYGELLRYTMLTKYYIYFHLLCYFQSPKLLLSLALFLDVIILNQITVFYRFFYLGAIPIIYNILLRLLKLHYSNLLEKLCKESLPRLEWMKILEILDITEALQLSKQTRFYHWSQIIILTLQIISWFCYLIIYLKAYYYKDLQEFLFDIILAQIFPYSVTIPKL